MPEIQSKAIQIIADKLSAVAAEITSETKFVNDLGVDSLEYVELVMELEEAFDVVIPDEVVTKIQTVGQAITYLEEYS